MTAEETTRGVAVEKLENMKKWSINTYKVTESLDFVCCACIREELCRFYLQVHCYLLWKEQKQVSLTQYVIM